MRTKFLNLLNYVVIVSFLFPIRLFDHNSTISAYAKTSIASSTIELHLIEGTVLLEERVRIALESALVDAYEDIDFNGAEFIAPIDIRDEGEWILLSLVGLANMTSEMKWDVMTNGVWSDIAIVNLTNSNIIASIAGTRLFSLELEQIPENILSEQSKEIIDPLSTNQPKSLLAENFIFPYPTGYQVYYGDKDGGVHPGEYTAVIGAGSLAVDLMSDGDTDANHSPNQLLAVSAGTVTRTCSDTSKNSTYILIDNGSSKFLYSHLLKSSSPGVGSQVNQGDHIGTLVTGPFNDGVCGYASQSSNFFHVHLEFPNTAFLTLGDWTLNTSTELWTKGSETWSAGQWKTIGSGGGSCDATNIPSGYTKCADEGGYCSFSGAKQVYYMEPILAMPLKHIAMESIAIMTSLEIPFPVHRKLAI